MIIFVLKLYWPSIATSEIYFRAHRNAIVGRELDIIYTYRYI